MNTPTLSRVGSAVAALIALTGLTSCPGAAVSPDGDDRTPPTVVLAVSGTSDDGLVEVANGTLVSMVRGQDAIVRATAADGRGVSAVELWVIPTRHCTSVGVLVRGLSVAPVARTTPGATATEASSQLTATSTLSGRIPPDCTVTYEVRARATNAADRPVPAPFTTASFVLRVAG